VPVRGPPFFELPEGLDNVVLSGQGTFDPTLGEFILDYDSVRQAADPAREVSRFLQARYSAAADLANWDRAGLDRTDKPQ
jgi:hypothetical protein